MAAVSKFSIKIQTKSISLPCRSHPSTFQIEELLSKIKTTVENTSSAEAICGNLSQLTGLYNCMNDLLTSPTTQVLLSHGDNRKWVDELVDESVTFLDICSSISDMLLEIKDHSRDLLCALRRRKGDHVIIENNIMKYNLFRKNLRKRVRTLIARLKQSDNLSGTHGSVMVDSDNHHLAAVIRAVIGVSEMIILVFESVLMFFSASVSKPNRWSIVVSKLMHKEMVVCEDQKEIRNVNEFESIDAALRVLCKYGFSSEAGNVQIAQCRLERLGDQIESMESGLECMFRFLVRTRVSLLNIVSVCIGI